MSIFKFNTQFKEFVLFLGLPGLGLVTIFLVFGLASHQATKENTRCAEKVLALEGEEFEKAKWAWDKLKRCPFRGQTQDRGD